MSEQKTGAQVFVLGMHRSGTSALTGALAGAGLFAGEPDDLTGASAENPLGFYERRDVRQVCDGILHAQGADWWKVSSFNVDRLSADQLKLWTARATSITETIQRDSVHRGWVIKEPRLCHVFSVFQRIVFDPLPVIVVRHPMEVARSLRRRNGFSIEGALALWESYNLAAFRNVGDLDPEVILYSEFIEDPVGTLAGLRARLEGAGFDQFSEEGVRKHIRPALRHERIADAELSHQLSPSQLKLWEAVAAKQVPLVKELPTKSFHDLQAFELDHSQVQKLRADIATLRNKIKPLQAAADEAKLVPALKATLDVEREKAIRADEQLRQASLSVTSQAEAVEALSKAHARLERDIALRELEVDVLRSAEAALMGEFRKMAEEIGTLTQSRTEAREQLEQERAESERERKNLRTQISELEKGLADQKRLTSNLERNLAKARSAVQAAEAAEAARVRETERLAKPRLKTEDLLPAEFNELLLGREGVPSFSPVGPANLRERVLLRARSLVGRRKDPGGGLDLDRLSAAIRYSGLFDDAAYVASNPDVAEAGLDPLAHYLRFGWREGRQPGGGFDAKRYLAKYPDVAASGLNPLAHYVVYGRDEGRRVSLQPSFAEAKTAGAQSSQPTPDPKAHDLEIRRDLPNLRTEKEMLRVSIIVPVHNALEDVRQCLQSICAHTFPAVQLIVVNDGSDEETSAYLEQMAAETPMLTLLRHSEAKGYTIAVNAGAKQAVGDVLVILNSDTIVPPFWLERLVDPLNVDATVAAVGPVSNAATWQSVPSIKAPDGSWAVNELPKGVDVVVYDRFVQEQARGLVAQDVRLLNGFCYAIRKSVFDSIGRLDGQAFPSGYGEETDLFLRVGLEGHRVQVVPNLFVFHAKSKSFGVERRKKLSAAGNLVLYERYGQAEVQAAAASLSESATLSALRERCLQGGKDVSRHKFRKLNITYLLPVRPGGGGVHSVIQEASGLLAMGHEVRVLIKEKDVEKYEGFYPGEAEEGVFETFDDDRQLIDALSASDVIIATHFLSVRMLREARAAYDHALFLYYVQDYEPMIVPANSELYVQAYSSYGELEGAVRVAKTRWLCRKVWEHHRLPVDKITPSVELSIYRRDESRRQRSDNSIVVTAMIRPETARRGAQETLDVLSELANRSSRKITTKLFGCSDEQLRELDLDETLDHENFGKLNREGVAELLQSSDLFIDMSTYQAFGRTAVEAMACGTVAAIPQEGGGTEYSWAGEAALPIGTSSVAESADALLALLADEGRFESMRELGYVLSSQFTVTKAALSVQETIYRHLAQLEVSREKVQDTNDRTSELAATKGQLSLSRDQQKKLLESSSYFSAEWYRRRHADVRRAKVDPVEHFLKKGEAEVRAPSPFFNMRWYMDKFPQYKAAGLNPLVYFLARGEAEGQRPAPRRKAPQTALWWDRVAELPWHKTSHRFEKPDTGISTEFLRRDRPAVAVVVPVYNAPDELRRCLRSLSDTMPPDVLIILIDDGSTDPGVGAILNQYANDKRFKIFRNEENLGFTSTVNRGFDLAEDCDVLLLNADTEVPDGLVRRLRTAAYSGERIATATPLSNNAGAFSAPVAGKENKIPEAGFADFARGIAQTSRRLYPQTPTGNGFCMYVRRDCLSEVGGFDAEAFPRGYGEENDFCMRAKVKGWRHVVDDASYVLHVRSASFGSEKEALIKQGRAELDARHPSYKRDVQAFLQSTAITEAREHVGKVAKALSRRSAQVRPRYLYVMPALSGRGGTPQTNQDLMSALSERIEPFLLQSNGTELSLSTVRDGEVHVIERELLQNSVEAFPHRTAAFDAIVSQWAILYEIELVHVRHLAWQSLGAAEFWKQLGLPIVTSFHDFYSVCPTIKLLDENNTYCAGKCTSTEGVCTYDLWETNDNPPLKNSAVYDWRSQFSPALRVSDHLVTTSQTAKDLVTSAFTELEKKPFSVIPHGRDFAGMRQDIVPKLEAGEPLRLVVPGSVGYSKGIHLVRSLAEAFGEQLDIHVLGSITQGGAIPGVTEHGPYKREEFIELVQGIRPHVGGVFSIWPETYCHTLTELWAAGVPVVGSPLGAVGERIGESGAGWVLSEATGDAAVDTFRQIMANRQEHSDKLKSVHQWQESIGQSHTTGWMAEQYWTIYQSILKPHAKI